MMKTSIRHMTILALFVLCLGTGCGSAFAEQVADMTVDVSNHQGKSVGDNLIDGNPATAWVGGGKGIGPGKWIELYFPSPVALDSLRIHNGNQGKGQFKKFRRVTKGVVLYPDETRQKFTLKPASGAQSIKLKPITAGSIKIIIIGVAPSSKDKSMGKAKVAVSEIAVFGTPAEGEVAESADGEEAQEDGEPKEESAEGEEKAKPAPEPEVKAVSKAEPEKAKPEPKPAPKPEEKKPVKAKPAPKKQTAKAKPKKKTAKKKTPPKKKAVAPAGNSITYMRPATAIPADKPVKTGVINPWLDIEFVAQIKRYFALLTTLHDSYPEVFTSDIRERERKEFLKLQDDMRKRKLFGQHHIAMLEGFGLGFDKPEINGDTAKVRVHGLYRYYLENDAFEYPVDTLFTFRKEGGKWLISNVEGK